MYQNLKAKAMRLARKVSSIKPGNKRPHELILVARLSSNENSYTIKLKHEEVVKVLSIAEGLRDRDAFLATGIAIGIIDVGSNDDVESSDGCSSGCNDDVDDDDYDDVDDQRRKW